MSPLWKSKPFWAFASISGGFGGAVAYDRWQARQLYNLFLEEARKYGQQPLLDNEQPPLLSLFSLCADSNASDAVKENFKRFAVQLLTVAGVDYVWAVAVDNEKVTREWNRVAQDANTPDKMFDEGKRVAEDSIKEHILRAEFKEQIGKKLEDTDSLWSKVREKVVSKRVWSSRFVALNQRTADVLNTEISHLQQEEAKEVTPIPSKKSFWRSSPPKATPYTPLLKVNSINQPFLLDCERSSSFPDRFMRFCFGQKDLVQSIGTCTLSLIAAVNENKQ